MRCEQHPVTGDGLDHRVGEGPERGVGPAPDHDANTAGAPDAGDPATEPLSTLPTDGIHHDEDDTVTDLVGWLSIS